MTDPPAGVREMRRATRPGGTVAAAVWDYAGEMTLLRRFWDAAVALDPAAADRDEGRCMPFCTPGELERLLVDGRPGGYARSRRSSWPPATTASRTSGSRSSSAWCPPAPTPPPSPPGGRAVLEGWSSGGASASGDDPFRLTARAWIATGRVA